MTSLFSTSDIAPKYQQSYWIEMICKSLMHLQISIQKKNDFYGEIKTDHLAYIQFSKTTADKSVVVRSKSEIAQADSQLVHLLIQQRGVSSLKQDGRMATIKPGQWVLCDTTRPSEFSIHHNRSETLVLQLDKERFKSRLGNLERFTAQPLTTAHGLGKVAASYINSTYAELNSLDEPSSIVVADSLIDLLCTNIQNSLSGAQKISESGNVMALQAKHFIEANLHEPQLTVAFVAAGLNVSKRYLHLLFEKEDTSVSRYIWDLRLQKCQQDLLSPSCRDRTITEIALSWGFKNSAHFSDLFKKKYGVSPRAYRKSCLG